MHTQSTWFINRRFLLKILLPVLMTLLLFIVALYQIIIPRFEEIVLGRKREMIRELTESVWHIADRYHREAARGGMSTEEAQWWTIAQVQHLRYGEEGKDYFWITDFQPRMIVHPFRSDLNGEDLSDFRDSEGKALFVEIVETVRKHGDGFVDYTWQWKDDSSRIVPKLSYVKPFRPWGWIIGTGIYIEDVRDEIAALEGNVIDISIWITVSISLLLLFITVQNLRAERKRQQAEQEVRESKEKYEALVEASTEGLLMVMEDRQLWFNRTLLGMLGYTEEEVRGVDLPSLFTDDVVAQLLDAREPEQIRSALNAHAETGLRRSDGSVIDVLLTVSPVGFYGKTGVVIIVKDMSHHKLIADALDESKQRFSALTNRLSLAVFRTDAGRGMRFVEANAATVRLFGYEGLEQLQKTDLRDHFDDAQSFAALRDEVAQHGFVTNRIARIRNRDHVSVMISISVAVVNDAAGRARFCDVLAEDVSAKKRSREDADRLAADLQAPISFLSQPVAPFVRDPVFCRLEENAGQVARLLSRPGTQAVLVRDDAGRSVGMITNEELRAALRADGRGAETGAFEIMRAPVLTVAQGDVVHDVLRAFREQGSSAAAVRGAGGAIMGTLFAAELERARLHTYDLFLLHLQHAETVEDVRAAHAALQGYVRTLIGTGAPLHVITHANTLISDTVGRRLIEIALRELGPPPRPFVFMALGSEGRGEQTLLTDQ
ncbi:MAG: cache domain-containing protein, partial [Bacteroidota bacterium]|nr:cache domain-containing protein [Bacteroidota bacterium]